MLSRLSTGLAVGLAALSVSCSSSDSTGTSTGPKPNERIGDIKENDTWKDGFKLTGLIAIHETATVDIDPGATITCTDAVQIQVGGTLRIKGGDKHARITCPHWRGILVAGNGTVDFTGIDLEGADVGVEAGEASKSVTLTNASITNSPRPFLVRANATMTLDHVTATTPTTLGPDQISVSEVYGTLVAKYLDYSANTNEGVMVQSGGSADISDSSFQAKDGFDMVSSYGGASLKVSYTTMSGAHCGVHMAVSHDAKQTPPGPVTIDHITSQDGNRYGITIYAATTATITNSNFVGLQDWIDLQGGPWTGVTFTGDYHSGLANIPQGAPAETGTVTAPVANAKPR
jgi:hypothetical protein